MSTAATGGGRRPRMLSGLYRRLVQRARRFALTIANTGARSGDYGAELNDTVPPGACRLYRAMCGMADITTIAAGDIFLDGSPRRLVFCGAVCKQLLAQKNIWIGAHIQQIHAVQDKPMTQAHLTKAQFARWQTQTLPTVDQKRGGKNGAGHCNGKGKRRFRRRHGGVRGDRAAWPAWAIRFLIRWNPFYPICFFRCRRSKGWNLALGLPWRP